MVDSLCFAGKANHLTGYASCLSDSHTTDQCPENVDIGAAFMSWQQGTGGLAALPTGSSSGSKAKLCYLFNAKEGSRCTYNPCKYAHHYMICKGPHPWSACKRAGIGDGRSLLKLWEMVRASNGLGWSRPCWLTNQNNVKTRYHYML